MVIGINNQIYNDSLLQDKFTFYQYDEKSEIMYIYNKPLKKWLACYYNDKKRYYDKFKHLTTFQVVQALKDIKSKIFIGHWANSCNDTIA